MVSLMFKVYQRLRRIHLRQSLKTQWARVKLFVLVGRLKIADLGSKVAN